VTNILRQAYGRKEAVTPELVQVRREEGADAAVANPGRWEKLGKRAGER
jgi:hypothetical protein